MLAINRMLIMQNSRTKATIAKINHHPFQRYESDRYDFFKMVSDKMREVKDPGAFLNEIVDTANKMK